MFTNRHVVIALLVAPVLAVLAWIGVGQIGAERAQPAVPGRIYPLVEKSNCRYPSGACDLQNEDLLLRLSIPDAPPATELVLTSSHPLEGVLIALAPAGEDDAAPSTMRAVDAEGLKWRLRLERVPGPEDRFRVVARAAGSGYFAEASTRFLAPREQ